MLAFPPNPSVGERHPDIEGAPSWEWDGSKWRPVGWSGPSLQSNGGVMTGPLTLAADPVEPLEAATKGYVDDEVVNVETAAKEYVDQKEPLEAPSDGVTYGRKDGGWRQTLPVEPDPGSDWLGVSKNDGATPQVWINPNTGGIEATHIDAVTDSRVGGNFTAGGIIQSSSGAGHALYAPHGGVNVGTTCIAGAWMACGNPGIRTSIGGDFFWSFHWNGNAYFNVDNAIGWQAFWVGCDESLKQDIAPSNYDCLATVERIPILQFRWKDNHELGKSKLVARRADNIVPVGLVAQRINDVDPTLIVKPPVVETAPESSGPGLMQIDSNNMFAVLIGAIQQLSERVRALEQRG